MSEPVGHDGASDAGSDASFCSALDEDEDEQQPPLPQQTPPPLLAPPLGTTAAIAERRLAATPGSGVTSRDVASPSSSNNLQTLATLWEGKQQLAHELAAKQARLAPSTIHLTCSRLSAQLMTVRTSTDSPPVACF